MPLGVVGTAETFCFIQIPEVFSFSQVHDDGRSHRLLGWLKKKNMTPYVCLHLAAGIKPSQSNPKM